MWTRRRGRSRRYAVEWDDHLNSVTVEPESRLHHDQVLEYNDKLENAERALVVLVENMGDDERMTRELMQKHKMEGGLADWLAGVTTELESVI